MKDITQFLLRCSFFVLMCTCCGVFTMQAQTVSGTVFDAQTMKPLPGVNILVQGTTLGTATNGDGNYKLHIPSLQDTLRFSFIGYQTQKIPINGRTEINIQLQPRTVEGQQLVVTALGIEHKKRSLTYSTQSVEPSQLTKAPPTRILQSLEGQVAGLVVRAAGTGINGSESVTLRGNRSINGSSTPLYIVDGVPSSPNDVSPDNIASINVLKGASAAAIYGSSAQNGAIVITTKKGTLNQTKFSINSGFTMGRPVFTVKRQTEYGQGDNGEYHSASEEAWGPKMGGQMVDQWSKVPGKAGTKYPYEAHPDNYKKFLQTSLNFHNNVQVNVGGQNTATVFSYTRTDARGLVPANTLKKNNLSLRTTDQLEDWLSLDAKLTYTRWKYHNNLSAAGSGQNAPFRILYTMPPNIRYQDYKQYSYTDPNTGLTMQNFWNPGSTTLLNPYWEMYKDPKQRHNEYLAGLISLTADLTDHLSLLLRGSLNRSSYTRISKWAYDSYAEVEAGRYQVRKNNGANWKGEFLLSYKKDVAKDWNVSARFGGSLRKTNGLGNLLSNTGRNLMILPNFFTISNSSTPVTTYTPTSRTETQSLYGLADIGWKDAIYLHLTGRNDWTSTLPPNSRSYFYPSVGLSVVPSSLIANFPNIISYMKLHATYARVGNGAPAYHLTRNASFSPGGFGGFLKFSNVLPATNLKPEITKSYEIGLTLQFLENRVGFNVTAYKENTYNQLFTISLPSASGAASFFHNGGNIENKGLEAHISATPIQFRNLKWDVGMNFSTNRNWVVSTSAERPKVVLRKGSYFNSYVVKQGEKFGNVYGVGWKRDGQGRVIVNSNGLPETTSGRSVVVANATPDWLGSISNTITYKNISFNFLITHRQGGTISNFSDAILYGNGIAKETAKYRDGGLIFGKNVFSNETAVLEDGSPNNIAVTAEDFWSYVGGRNTAVAEAFVQSATNMRLKRITLTYNLPTSLFGASTINGVSVSFVARNLFFIIKKGEWDPDILTGAGKTDAGFNVFPRPTKRTFGFSLHINF